MSQRQALIDRLQARRNKTNPRGRETVKEHTPTIAGSPATVTPIEPKPEESKKILNTPTIASGKASSKANPNKPKTNPNSKRSVSDVVSSTPRHVFSNLRSVDGNDIEAIAEQCGMNFDAVKEDLTFTHGDKSTVVPDKMAVVRDDDGIYLGTVGRERPVVQYIDNLRFTEIFAQEGAAEYEYGGIIGNGKQAFLVMKSAECFELTPGDKVECYFYIQSSHDSSQALSIVPTPLRPMNNTIFIHPKFHAMKIKHTKKVDEKRADARKGIARVKKFFGEFEESFRRLADIELKDNTLDTYLRSIFPDPKDGDPTIPQGRRDKVRDIMMLEPSLKTPPTTNTLLGAYFAVIYFCDHYLAVNQSQTKDALTTRIESKLMVDSTSAKRKADAFALALKLKEKME